LGKKKKPRFRARYFLLLMLLFFVYEGWKAFMPIKGYLIKWSQPVQDERILEVRKLISEPLPKSIQPVRSDIIGLDWVKNVKWHKNIRGVVSILIQPRVPIARISNMKGICVDEEGVLFKAEGIDTLPIIKVKDDSLLEGLQEAVQILKITRDVRVEEVKVISYGLESRIGNIKVLWGKDSYPEKYKLLKKIYKTGIVSSGRLDFRFDDQVVLRR